MKLLTNKLFWMCALLVCFFGIFPAASHAENSQVVIDTNGNIDINDSTNTVTITQNGNNPLIVNNINLPNQNLVIKGDLQNQPLITFDRGNTNPGPVINVSQSNPQITAFQPVQISPAILNNQPKPVSPVSESQKFPIIIELEKPHTVKEPENFITTEHHLPSTGATINVTQTVTNSLAAATGSLSDPVYINIQDVHEATKMTSNASGDIILQ